MSLRELSEPYLTQDLFHLAEIGGGLGMVVTGYKMNGHLTECNGTLQDVKMYSVYF